MARADRFRAQPVSTGLFFLSACVLSLTAHLPACSSEIETREVCEPGAVPGCDCHGQFGEQMCELDQTWGACVCDTEDATADRVGDADSDTTLDEMSVEDRLVDLPDDGVAEVIDGDGDSGTEDETDLDTVDVSDDGSIGPGGYRVQVARFTWPSSVSESDTYRIRTNSFGHTASSAIAPENDSYRLHAVNFGIER